VGQGKDVIDSLSQAESELDFDAEMGNVLSASAAALHAMAGEGDVDVTDIIAPLQSLLDAISATYTMARERDVHARFPLDAAFAACAA
jgi:hypothetical protein